MWHVYRKREILTGFGWGKAEEKTPFGRPVRVWEYNIKIYFRKWKCVDCIGLINCGEKWPVILNTVMDLQVL